MSASREDVWAMWALWHWRSGISEGVVFGTRRALKSYLIGTTFANEDHYREMVGVGKPYKIVKVDVSWAK